MSFNGGRRDQPDQAVPQTSNRPTPQAEITGNGDFEKRAPPTMPANPKPKKARPQWPGFLFSGHRS